MAKRRTTSNRGKGTNTINNSYLFPSEESWVNQKLRDPKMRAQYKKEVEAEVKKGNISKEAAVRMLRACFHIVR